jgi:cyclase
MKKLHFLVILLVSPSFCSSGQTFQSKHFTIRKIADGVYAAISKNGGYAICNAGIVDLGDATLIFDPFMIPSAAEDLRKAALILTGHEIKYIVNSHYHNDHIGGNQVFGKAAVISTELTRELIKKFQPQEIVYDRTEAPIQLDILKKTNTATMTPHELEENIMWTGYFESMVKYNDSLKIVLPDITFDDRLILYGTKRTVILFSYGEAHTESDLFLYLPDEQIAFMGDLLFIQNQPWIRSGDPEKWKTYLDSVGHLNINVMVPGHGPVGTGADIAPMKLYFDNVKNAAITCFKKGILPENDLMLKSPSSFDNWFLSNFYKPNVISEYNRLYKK